MSLLLPLSSSFVATAVSLTKVVKKGRQIKDTLIEDIRDSVDKYESMYIFRFDDLRSTHMADVRKRFINSRYAFVYLHSLPRTPLPERLLKYHGGFYIGLIACLCA